MAESLELQAGTGVSDGFAALYQEMYEPMVRLAVLLVDSREVAEETVQEAFAQVLVRYDRLLNPEGYLRRCVVNGGREVQRRRRVARRHVQQPGPDASLGADHVLDCVSQLPYRQRTVIVLRYYCDLSEADTAAAMGIPPGSVKSAMHRGLRRLRTELT